jgi:hypothetical protein
MDDEATRRDDAWNRLFTLMKDPSYRYFVQGMLMGGYTTAEVEDMVQATLEFGELVEENKRRAHGG